MSVELKIYGETAGEVMTELAKFATLIYQPAQRPVGLPAGGAPVASREAARAIIDDTAETTFAPLNQQGEPAVTNTPRAGESEAQTAARRERGKPSPGKARRTKEEIAEDEAADAADNPFGGQQISTDPENRVGPEDDPETEAQDKADEQAEVEANRAPEKPLTREDVKGAMTKYLQKYGMAATQEDGPRLIGQVLGAPPKGEEAWKLSLVPEDDQDKLKKLVGAFEAATKENPYKRAAV